MFLVNMDVKETGNNDKKFEGVVMNKIKLNSGLEIEVIYKEDNETILKGGSLEVYYTNEITSRRN